jgi:hypothetical protein
MKMLDKLSVVPDPWNRMFLMFWNLAAVAVTVDLGWKSGATTLWPAGLVLIAAIAAVMLAVPRHRSRNDSSTAPEAISEQRHLRERKSWIPAIAAPLLLAAPFVLTAVAIGTPGCSGFPAAMTAMLSGVAFAMRGLEGRLRADSAADDPSAKRYYVRTLSWMSTLLFFFGVVTLWPWLGKIYGNIYFWILVVGVLSPQLYFWGKVRQPHAEHPMDALIRFNRLLPYIAVILLVAIFLG